MSGILGQLKPAATTWEDLYTVPANTALVARVIISNLLGTDSTFRIALSKDGDPIEDKHRITGGDEPIVAQISGSTIGFAVSSGDIIRVFSGSGQITFTATGETRDEI